MGLDGNLGKVGVSWVPVYSGRNKWQIVANSGRGYSGGSLAARSPCARGYSGADGAIPGGVRRRAPRALGAIPVIDS